MQAARRRWFSIALLAVLPLVSLPMACGCQLAPRPVTAEVTQRNALDADIDWAQTANVTLLELRKAKVIDDATWGLVVTAAKKVQARLEARTKKLDERDAALKAGSTGGVMSDAKAAADGYSEETAAYDAEKGELARLLIDARRIKAAADRVTPGAVPPGPNPGREPLAPTEVPSAGALPAE